MTERLQVYKCDSCGIVVEILHAGDGDLECCGTPMKLLTEQTADATTEKHVPVVEKADGGVKVLVGSVPHPMTQEHLIEWIEVQSGDQITRRYLKPDEAPEAVFEGLDAGGITAREYCNMHGLWKS